MNQRSRLFCQADIWQSHEPSPAEPLRSSLSNLLLVLGEDPAWRDLEQEVGCVEVSSGTNLFEDPAPFIACRFLVSGQLRAYLQVPDGRQLTLFRLVPGDICLSRFDGGPGFNDADVGLVSETNVTLLNVSQTSFDSLFATSAVFRRIVLGGVFRQLQDLTLLIGRTTFNDLQCRLAVCLSKLFEHSRNRRIYVTHQDLAQEIGTSREVISRVLGRMEVAGAIALSRGCIDLLSRDRLESCCDT